MGDDGFSRLEIALKPELFDADGEGVKAKAKNIGVELDSVRKINVISLAGILSEEQKRLFKKEMTNPVTQVSSYDPLVNCADADWIIHRAWRPGVRDNKGATAHEELVDLFGPGIKDTEVYYSEIFAVQAEDLTKHEIEKVAQELSNDIVQTYNVVHWTEWDNKTGIGEHRPRVMLNREPRLDTIPLEKLTPQFLQKYSDERSLALNPRDIPVIIDYFNDQKVIEKREKVGLRDPTDVELEYISQARSDHCNHNTIKGLFMYHDLDTGESSEINNLFEKCIEEPTFKLKDEKDYVVSVLWDNAGVARFDDRNNYTITGETHNSPSNMEAYGGAITGIVGIYRDPMGTGKGSKIIFGAYGFCTADPTSDDPFMPKLHPRQMFAGIIGGVRDGGNRSGNPTPFGNVLFHPNYLGKGLVFVTTAGIMPAEIDGKPSHKKYINSGNKIIMCGGRVGKDGIHGVTAASEELHEGTPAGHVQIGDPYTQKKMHDFLIEARDEGLIDYITDNGGGGLSSSVGETARIKRKNGTTGGYVELDKVPFKYDGLDYWEMWVSESQERMTVSVRPEHVNRFMELSKKHSVESTVIGEYTEEDALHITYNGKTLAYITTDLLNKGFPQWEFDAEWTSPENRGMYEPVIGSTDDHNSLLDAMLSRLNIASREFISRQYDHEVQGGKVIGPLVGIGEDGVPNDMPSDAAVIRPILGSKRGLVITQTLNPEYSQIDAYHMTTATIDEAVRNALVVGGNIEELGGVDNFCFPCIEYDPVKNPDGKFKAAQLVRANLALKDACLTYGIPLLSGKDSMYVDGHPVHIESGVKKKVSGPETMQFTITTTVDDVSKCLSSDAKEAGNLIYLIGETKNELGGSEFYSMLGEIGLNVPKTDMEKNMKIYGKFIEARDSGYIASAKDVRQKGGLITNLVMMAGGGNLGFDIDLARVDAKECWLDEQVLYSESTGRILAEVTPQNRQAFERVMGDYATELGMFTDEGINVAGVNGKQIINHAILPLKRAWKAPFKDRGYVTKD